MKRLKKFLSFIPALIISGLSTTAATADPIPVKVAVVAMYEMGAVTGDQPGEYQFWVERENLNQVYAFPFGPHDLRMNDQGLMGVCSGPGVSA